MDGGYGCPEPPAGMASACNSPTGMRPASVMERPGHRAGVSAPQTALPRALGGLSPSILPFLRVPASGTHCHPQTPSHKDSDVVVPENKETNQQINHVEMDFLKMDS